MEEKLRLFKRRCKEHNLKITPQRMAIFKALIESREHPSSTVIYEKVRHDFPHISFDTVNRTLITFVKIGMAQVVEGRGDPKRFDPNLKSHHHFRCLRCGKIFDFYFSDYEHLTIPDELKSSYKIIGKRVHLEGYCPSCIDLNVND